MRRLRERRAAALLPVDGQAPLPAEDQLAPAVAETLAALDLGPEHAAAVQLARRYAKVIDEAKDPAWAMRWIGPLLLKLLESCRRPRPAEGRRRSAGRTRDRPGSTSCGRPGALSDRSGGRL